MHKRRNWKGANRRQRGTALLVVSFVLIIILVGGLAAVAVTSGELSSSRGYRARQVTRTCAEAGVEHARALAGTDSLRVDDTNLGGLTYRTGHYGTSTQDTAVTLDPSQFDFTSLSEGENITNSLSEGSKSSARPISTTATCSGSGHGEREMQMIFLYGTAKGAQ